MYATRLNVVAVIISFCSEPVRREITDARYEPSPITMKIHVVSVACHQARRRRRADEENAQDLKSRRRCSIPAQSVSDVIRDSMCVTNCSVMEARTATRHNRLMKIK